MRERWLKASARIVASADNPGNEPGPLIRSEPEIHEYVVELMTPQGSRQAPVSEFSRFVHGPGAFLHVEVGSKTGEIKVDHDAMTAAAVQFMRQTPEARPGYARRAASAPRAAPDSPPPAAGGISPFDIDAGPG